MDKAVRGARVEQALDPAPVGTGTKPAVNPREGGAGQGRGTRRGGAENLLEHLYLGGHMRCCGGPTCEAVGRPSTSTPSFWPWKKKSTLMGIEGIQ